MCQIGPFSTESTESKCMMNIPVICDAPVLSIEVEQPTCNTIETTISDQGADSSSMIPEKIQNVTWAVDAEKNYFLTSSYYRVLTTPQKMIQLQR